MKIFIDFDDVLFNTKLFYQGIKNIFLSNGVPEEIFLKYYKDPKLNSQKGTVRKYNPYKQIEKIGSIGYDVKKLKKDFEEFIKDTSKYILKDGKEFLGDMEEEELYIVSFGDKKFQGEKIKNSGISQYFKKVLIVDETKAIGIRKILKSRKSKSGEPLIFIDDREKFLRDIKQSYPGMATFLLKREEGRYDDEKTKYCDFVVKDFNEVSQMLHIQ